MKISRISLRSETGKFVHLALALTLLYFGIFHFLAFLLLVIDVIFLWKKARKLFFLFSIMAIFFCLRLFSLSENLIISGETNLLGTVLEVQDDRLYLSANGKYLVYCQEIEAIVPGDIIEIEGAFFEIESKQIPYGFDYDTYLLSSRIKGVLKANTIAKIGHSFSFASIPYAIRNYVVAVMPEKAAEYVLLLTFGDDFLTNENIMRTWSELSVVHLFAISGMHVGLIAAFLDKMQKNAGVPAKARKIVLVILLIAFNLATGFRIPVFRATILYIAAFFQKKNPTISSLDRLSLLFVGMALYNPWYLENVGFRLSFLVCFCLMLGRKIIGRNKKGNLISVTLMANICSLPVTLSLNHGIGLLFLPANIVFILFVEFLMLPASFLTLAFPFVAKAYVWLATFFEQLTHWFASIDTWITLGIAGEFYVTLFFLAFFLFCANFQNERKRMSYFVLFSMLLAFISFPTTILTKVMIFDVGQGDAILVDDPKCRILIDTGPPDSYDALIGYLLDRNIRYIDYLVITHNHDDHYGEISDITDVVEIGAIVTGSDPPAAFDGLLMIVKEGDVIGRDGLMLTVISANNDNSDENDNSLVLYGTIGSDTWLFMGDAGINIENNILRKYLLFPDVVKVGHHGSDSASSNAFIQAMSPQYAIVSVGKNGYGLPDENVLIRWEDSGSTILNTKTDGTVEFVYFPLAKHPLVITYKKRQPWFCQMSSFFDL